MRRGYIFCAAVIFEFLWIEIAAAQSPSTTVTPFWVPLVSALIGAVAVLIAPLIKDFIINKFLSEKEKSFKQAEVFRHYIGPLTMSCEKLIWRLAEIFIDSRAIWLKTSSFPFVYCEYKRKSTLYRIASLLGWMRAIKLELNALPRGGRLLNNKISKALFQIEKALADGVEVEIMRFDGICKLWNLPAETAERRDSLAAEFEWKLYALAGDELKHHSDALRKLDRDRKKQVCRGLADFLCEKLKRNHITDDVIDETVERAIEQLSYREALIYREWQDAIADSMLERDEDSLRRYKIIGYEKFEKILDGRGRWMETYQQSIADIDFDKIDPNDFRAKQLEQLAVAVAAVLIAISESDEHDLIDPSALSTAKKIVEMLSGSQGGLAEDRKQKTILKAA